MKTLSLFLTLVFSGIFISASFAQAVDSDEASIKKSLMQRVSAIDEMKLAHKVGENNLGFLTQRAALTPDETKLMNDENKDRRALYAILAKRLKLTVKVVGQGRAEELRKKSASGVWLQDPTDNNWYKQK